MQTVQTPETRPDVVVIVRPLPTPADAKAAGESAVITTNLPFTAVEKYLADRPLRRPARLPSRRGD